MPGGFPWGTNAVHNVAAAKRHMQLADLVVVWGSSLSVLANYFDPWHPDSRWAKPPPVLTLILTLTPTPTLTLTLIGAGADRGHGGGTLLLLARRPGRALGRQDRQEAGGAPA